MHFRRDDGEVRRGVEFGGCFAEFGDEQKGEEECADDVGGDGGFVVF